MFEVGQLIHTFSLLISENNVKPIKQITSCLITFITLVFHWCLAIGSWHAVKQGIIFFRGARRQAKNEFEPV